MRKRRPSSHRFGDRPVLHRGPAFSRKGTSRKQGGGSGQSQEEATEDAQTSPLPALQSRVTHYHDGPTFTCRGRDFVYLTLWPLETAPERKRARSEARRPTSPVRFTDRPSKPEPKSEGIVLLSSPSGLIVINKGSPRGIGQGGWEARTELSPERYHDAS